MDNDAPVIVFKRKTKGAAVPRARLTQADDGGDEQNEAGADSPAALARKLKKKARAKPAPAATVSFGDDDEGAPVPVQKSSLSRKITLNRTTAATITLDDERAGTPKYDAKALSELRANHAARPKPQDEDAPMDVDTSNLPISTLDDDTAETTIPSLSSVAAAKEKRTRLRAAPGPGEDYISLSLIQASDAPAGPHPNSRLAREEDELGEGDDEFADYTAAQERIALGKKSRKKEAVKRREEMAELIADAEEVDEETAEWENEQLRRGGHADEPAPAAKPVYVPTPIPEVTPLPTLAPALARLTASLTTLTTSHASSASTLAALAQERAALDAREAELRAGARQSRPRRAWFGAFREWLEGVAAFLDEKYPALEKVEQEHESLVRERAERVAKRRRSDDTDDLAMFLGGAPVAEADEGTDPAHRPERRAARTARHQARAAARASADEEGYSTDGELEPADAADLRAALSALASRADGVLADVHVPEFRDPARGQGLAAWFGAWRAQFEDVYVGAWGGLGALGAWEFWARLELARAGWCPIERGAQELDAFGWFRALHAFARPDGEDGELGPEGDLAAAMVGTAAVPRTVRLLEAGALDPYDAGAVRRAAEFAEQVEALCGREAKYEMYIAAVSAVFAREVTAFEARAAPFVRTGGAARFDPGAIPARRRVIARVGKLVRGAVRWRRVAGAVGTLERAVAAALVLAVRLAEGGWDVGGEEGVRKIVEKVPSELVPDAVKARLAQ